MFTLHEINKDYKWPHVNLGQALLSNDFLFLGLSYFRCLERGQEPLHKEE